MLLFDFLRFANFISNLLYLSNSTVLPPSFVFSHSLTLTISSLLYLAITQSNRNISHLRSSSCVFISLSVFFLPDSPFPYFFLFVFMDVNISSLLRICCIYISHFDVILCASLSAISCAMAVVLCLRRRIRLAARIYCADVGRQDGSRGLRAAAAGCRGRQECEGQGASSAASLPSAFVSCF